MQRRLKENLIILILLAILLAPWGKSSQDNRKFYGLKPNE